MQIVNGEVRSTFMRLQSVSSCNSVHCSVVQQRLGWCNDAAVVTSDISTQQPGQSVEVPIVDAVVKYVGCAHVVTRTVLSQPFGLASRDPVASVDDAAAFGLQTHHVWVG